MFAFLRVVVFYAGFAAFLTWAIFAMGWADALELPGFEGGAQAPTATAPSVTPVVVPPPDPQAKLSQPREIRLPAPEPRREVVVAPPVPPPQPPPIEVAKAPVAVDPPRPAQPLPPPVPQREVRVPDPAPAPVLPPPQPVAPPVVSRPEPVPLPKASVAAPQPRVAEAAPIAPPPAQPVRPPVAREPAARPAVQPVVDMQRRIAGFGADDFLDQLEETRRARDDAPCVMFRGVQFRAGSTVFAPGARTELDTIARVLREFPARRIEVGSKLGPGRPMASDAALRVDRAMLVRQTLISLGIDGERLTVDTAEAYERVADDVSRARGARVQSIGLCIHGG